MDRLTAWLVHPVVLLGIKSTLLIGLGGLVAALLGAGRARIRYRVWCGVFVGLAVLPLLQITGSGIQWRIPAETRIAPPPVPKTVAPSPVRVVRWTAVPRTVAERPVGAVAAAPTDLRQPPRDTVVPDAGQSVVKDGHPVGWLITGWLTGVLLLFMRLLVGRIQAHRLFHRSRRLTDRAWEFVRQVVAKQSRVPTPPKLASHERIPVPLTFGVRRPVVMLPDDADDWSLDRRRAVLLHEFTHIRRRDDLVRLLARVLAMAYWCHPLVWVAFRMLKVEQEKSCDERVLQSGIRPSDYATHLVALAREVGRRGALRSVSLAGAATLGMARPHELEGRLKDILTTTPLKETNMKRVMTGMVLMLATVGLMAVQPTAKTDAVPEVVPTSVGVPAVAPDEEPAAPAQPDTPKPEKPAKAPKAPKAPKVVKKVKVSTDDDGNVFIIKDGDSVRKIRVKSDGDEDNVFVLAVPDAPKAMFVKEIEVDLDQKMAAVRAQLEQAMALLNDKMADMEALNHDLARRMAKMQVNDPKVQQQLKETMATVTENLKKQMEQNAAALDRLKQVEAQLAEKADHHRMEWVEKHHELDEQQLEELEKLEELKARKIEVMVRRKEHDAKRMEAELKKLEEKLAREHHGRVMVWVDEDEDVDSDMDHDVDVKVRMLDGNRVFVGKDAGEMNIDLKIGLVDLKKGDRKALKKAVKELEKSIPKGVTVDAKTEADAFELSVAVPESVNLSDADRDKLEKAINHLLDTVDAITGEKAEKHKHVVIRKEKIDSDD